MWRRGSGTIAGKAGWALILETSNEWSIRLSFEQLEILVGALMYVFGVVVTDVDETPIGRASAALCAELPRLFPEHRFEFLNPSELPKIGELEARALLFHVLASQICVEDEEPDLSELASPELLQTIQDSVDRIVAAAKAKSLN
jgi:hypothetical protein